MKRLSLILLLQALIAATSWAQFEDLFQSEESDPEHIAQKEAEAKRDRELGPIRLLSPTTHTQPVLGAQASANGQYLLTYDADHFKVWDIEQRIPLVQQLASELPYQSEGSKILGVYFTKTERQVCVVLERQVHFYDDFNFSKPTAFGHHYNALAHCFHGPSQSVFLLSTKEKNYPRETDKPVALVVRQCKNSDENAMAVIAELEVPGNAFDVTRRYASQRSDWQLSLNPDATEMLFYTGPESPTLSIIPGDTPSWKSIDTSKAIVGFLPDGRLLAAQKNSDGYQLSFGTSAADMQNPWVSLSEPHASRQLKISIPPTDEGLLFATTSTTFATYDFTNTIASQGIHLTGQTAEAAAPLIASQKHEQLVLFRNAEDVSQIERFSPERSLMLGAWTTLAWTPDSVYPLDNAFRFIAKRGRQMRLVELLDNGVNGRDLSSLPVNRPIAAIAAPLDGEHWYYFFHGGEYARFNPKSGEALAVKSLGPNRFKHANGYSYSLGGFYGSSASADQRYIALHYNTQAFVFDTDQGSVVDTMQFPNNIAFVPGKGSMVALSPNGQLLAYGYGTSQDGKAIYHLCLYDRATRRERWHKEMDPHQGESFLFNLNFFEQGQQLFATDSGGRQYVTIDAQTGEFTRQPTFAYQGPGPLHFSARGNQYFTTKETKLLQYALPGASLKQSIDLGSQPDFYGPIGSERFILSYRSGASQLQLTDLSKQAVVADIYLFDDEKQWLIRNPQTGLFTSNNDAQEHLFYVRSDHLNPLAAYFDKFYRPRLMGSLIQGLSPKPTLDVEQLRFAPRLTVQIDGPQKRGLTVEDEFETVEVPEESVTLKVTASCEGSPIQDIRIYQNGKLVTGGTRGLFVEDDEPEEADEDQLYEREESFTFTLAEGRNRFRAIAINDQGTESMADEIIVYSADAPEPTNQGLALHLFVVGINEYANPDHNLNYAQADATAVRDLLQKQSANIFSRTQVYSLINEEATRENIIATLENIKAEASPRDAFIFYFAGHGVVSDDALAAFYLAPSDLTQLYGNAQLLRQRGISSYELLEYSRDIAAQKQLFILDACQSEGALKTVAQRGAAEEEAIAQLARSTGTHWLTATASDQTATEFETLGHGAFTYTLLEALQGKADSGDGIVSVNELKAYLESQVPEITEKHKGQAQYPASYGYGQDFPIGTY
ncbi:caspase family protein [Cerasicoccus fimbriatus]|uniref:caspase family protein n=1 Tax=Cerasicoccus fimbriatus TaxID=3014554 RepID=UPI0022B4D004|nr:caspase family protein [Cerasicoccus sp. TK19100]